MYSEDGLLGWTQSVDEQADKVSPAMTSIRKERMNLLLQGAFGGGTINCPALIVKQGADLCTEPTQCHVDHARTALDEVVTLNLKHLNHPSV